MRYAPTVGLDLASDPCVCLCALVCIARLLPRCCTLQTAEQAAAAAERLEEEARQKRKAHAAAAAKRAASTAQTAAERDKARKELRERQAAARGIVQGTQEARRMWASIYCACRMLAKAWRLRDEKLAASRAAAAAKSSGTSPTGGRAARSLASTSSEDKLKEFMNSCGLKAWHSHFVKHTTIRTPQQLRMITAFDLKKMATAANMRLDQKTIDQVSRLALRLIRACAFCTNLCRCRCPRAVSRLEFGSGLVSVLAGAGRGETRQASERQCCQTSNVQ
eukprot:COSAG05_NODE_1404_length_4970_cov_15292.071649_2_plen_278_part_00